MTQKSIFKKRSLLYAGARALRQRTNKNHTKIDEETSSFEIKVV